ncbi:MAG TPA: matrixin family metalloprotease, partial [Thermoanaerobaculia bacterium]|nr:matrixin family metalloprotease [Thermoanaerobaculia bacterium]
RFFLNNANGPACCLTASQQSSQILSGITPWGIASHGGATTRSGAKRDGQNVISWGKLGGTTLGVTTYVTTDTSQSQVCNGVPLYRAVEMDVRFNNAFNWQTSSTCTNGFDLAGVSVHEFGHVIGLGHSNVLAATMYASVAACDFTKTSLETDDRNGYSAIYSCGGGGGGGGGGKPPKN